MFRVHENPQKLDALFSSFFMTPVTWKFTKIRQYDFVQFSWKRLIFVDCHGVMKVKENWIVWFLRMRGHEKWRKSKLLIFISFHLLNLIFVDFHVPRVMKNEENWIVWFLWIFMYPGGHESWIKLNRLIFVDFQNMKVEENQSVIFLWIFMYPGPWKLKKIEVSDFVDFHVPGVMKVEEIEMYDFCRFSCTFFLPNYPEIMVKHVKNKVQAIQRSKTCPLVTRNWTNQVVK